METSKIITKLVSLSKVTACILLSALVCDKVYAEFFIAYSVPAQVTIISSAPSCGCSSCGCAVRHYCYRCHHRRHVVVIHRVRPRPCSSCVVVYRRSSPCSDCYIPPEDTNTFVEEYGFVSPDFDMRTADDMYNDP